MLIESSILPQVSDQVLTEQMQTTISQMVRTFIEVAQSFILLRITPLKILNGDLQALLLVSTIKRVHLTKELLSALQVVRARIDQAAAIISESMAGKVLGYQNKMAVPDHSIYPSINVSITTLICDRQKDGS
jgi:hypothetical protein